MIDERLGPQERITMADITDQAPMSWIVAVPPQAGAMGKQAHPHPIVEWLP